MMTRKILLVDDEQGVLDSFRFMLRKQFEIDTALGPEEGLKVLSGPESYAVIVTDLRMPGMDGVRFLTQAKEISPESVRLMLTGFADVEAAMDAVNEGQIFRFLAKPCPQETLEKALLAALEQYQLVVAEKELLRGTLRGSIQVLTEALSLANPEAYGRSLRIKALAGRIANAAGTPLTWEIELAAMLSHIGCMALPRAILEKLSSGQTLSPEEQSLYETHPTVGAGLIENIPRLEHVAEMVGRQHEQFCSSPLAKADPGANLLRIVNDYDILEMQGNKPEDALRILRSRAECYDPILISALEQEIKKEINCVLRRIAVVELKEGMVLEEAIYTRQGLLLLAKGTEMGNFGIRRMMHAARAFDIIEPVTVRIPRELL